MPSRDKPDPITDFPGPVPWQVHAVLTLLLVGVLYGLCKLYQWLFT